MSAVGGAVAAAGELTEALRSEIEEEMGSKIVELWDMELGDAGGVFVAEILRGNTIVEDLHLYNCGIGSAGARALGESLAEDNATLKTLHLNGDKVGDVGAESMARMLRKNTTLEWLNLVNCGVGVRGARALGEVLKENISLTSLSLGENYIGNDGAEAFAEALRSNESLKHLHLHHCHLTDVSSLLDALRESNSSLKTLRLDYNSGIEYVAIKNSIHDLLRENKAVQPASAERRARCLLFCCLQLALKAHEHVVPSIGAVPVPVMQYAVEHAGELHVAKRFEVGDIAVRESSAGVRDRSTLSGASDLQPAAARRR